MIVVSNTSPILNLIAIGQASILEKLYGHVLIPPAVERELSIPPFESTPVRALAWVETRALTTSSALESLLLILHEGEAEAIALATEIGSDLLLIDERRGRGIASRMGIKIIGLLGVLIQAKRQGLIFAVRPVLDDLIVKAGFWTGRKLYSRVLEECGE